MYTVKTIWLLKHQLPLKPDTRNFFRKLSHIQRYVTASAHKEVLVLLENSILLDRKKISYTLLIKLLKWKKSSATGGPDRRRTQSLNQNYDYNLVVNSSLISSWIRLLEWHWQESAIPKILGGNSWELLNSRQEFPVMSKYYFRTKIEHFRNYRLKLIHINLFNTTVTMI